MRLPPLLPKDSHLGWTRLAWLIYLPFIFLQPFFEHASAAVWAASVGAVAVFLPIYFWAYWLPPRRVVWIAVVLFFLGVGLAPWNPLSSTFVIYAAGFLGRVGRPRFGAACLAVLLAGVALCSLVFHLRPEFWAAAALFSLVIGGVNIHFAEVGRANLRLAASRQENEKLAKIAERERIARDLHDLLGHTLSLIALKAELASRLLAGDPERAATEIREVERISREALHEVRSAVTGYRSEGLTAELARARLALESAGIRPEYFTMPVALAPAAETALALALREAVTNVVRHSGARACTIVLEQRDEATRLEVRDDGTAGTAPAGTGLAVMRERIAGLGGQVNRRTEAGTTLEITLPTRPANAHRTADSALGAGAPPVGSLRPGEAL